MSFENLYHLLHFIPAVERWEMPPALERAAQQLVRSGRLRINADAYRNFVRHGTADSNLTFTARELTDPQLLPRVRTTLAALVAPAAGPQGIDDLLARFKNELKKARGVEEEKEMRVARVIAQSCHPAVMQLLLESQAEIFVSYSHNVSDLLAVHEWQENGSASGLQATDERALQVYISCGGDPFFEGENKTYLTDGFSSLARMVVIGGQEIGHFADLRREGHMITGRYSLSALPLRRADIAHLEQWRAVSAQRIARLKRREDALAFYDKRGKYSPGWVIAQLQRALAWPRYALASRPKDLPTRLHTYPAMRAASSITAFLDDMTFNLTPMAAAYRRADPVAEEQIACIEAVARVPQQVTKWGHDAVRAAWPELYRFYYGPIIAGCRAALHNPPPSQNLSFVQVLTRGLRRRLRRRPDYYPN